MYFAGTITFLYPWPLGSHASVNTNCVLAKFKFQIALPKAVKGEKSVIRILG